MKGKEVVMRLVMDQEQDRRREGRGSSRSVEGKSEVRIEGKVRAYTAVSLNS
jgi:hypothetical protein